MSKILLVEDEEAIAELEKDYLELSGFEVTIEMEGNAGLQRALSEDFDMIILDVMLPGMDGFEICERIRQEQNTPILMVSAKKEEYDKIHGLGLGADDYITKPFNLDLLNLRINNLIKWHNSSDHNKAHLQPHIKDVHITSLDEKLIQKATDYVEQNLSDTDLTVEQLSSILNMSRVHLYKKMLSITGNTPSEFIRTIRLRYAERLLCESQLSVSEISYQVGFNNPRYFSKYFKEMYGDMPSHYKEKNGK